jgi:hypothetical protein
MVPASLDELAPAHHLTRPQLLGDTWAWPHSLMAHITWRFSKTKRQ